MISVWGAVLSVSGTNTGNHEIIQIMVQEWWCSAYLTTIQTASTMVLVWWKYISSRMIFFVERIPFDRIYLLCVTVVCQWSSCPVMFSRSCAPHKKGRIVSASSSSGPWIGLPVCQRTFKVFQDFFNVFSYVGKHIACCSKDECNCSISKNEIWSAIQWKLT